MTIANHRCERVSGARIHSVARAPKTEECHGDKDGPKTGRHGRSFVAGAHSQLAPNVWAFQGLTPRALSAPIGARLH